MELDVDDRSRGTMGVLALTAMVLASAIGDAQAEEKSAVATMFDPYLTMPGQATPTFMRPEAPPVAVAPAEPTSGEPKPTASHPPVSNPAVSSLAAAKEAEPQAASSTGTAAAAPQKAAPRPHVARAGVKIGSGRASWYQHPGRTASGELFRPDALTAAHRSLPFGSRVRVVNQGNGRSVVLRINDRANQQTAARRPYVIDLSRGSARALGITGLAQVALYKAD